MQQKKIPTIVGLLLIISAVLLFRFAFERMTPLLSRASGNPSPEEVTVTNVSDTSFTVTWITRGAGVGSVRLDGGKNPLLYTDDSGTATTHSVTIRNLTPDTTYTYRIADEKRPYQTRTGPAVTGVGTTIEPAFGKVSAPDGTPIADALVYLTPDGGQMLSTVTKASGTWVIPLHLARSEDLTRYLASSSRINETILIRSPDGESSAFTDTLNDNPVPDMTIGKTYDFRKIQAAAPPTVLGTAAPQIAHTVSITKPAEGVAIPSDLPLIQGTGIPGNTVLVVIGINNPTSDTVTVSDEGIFRYTPKTPLSPGKQSVTITTADANQKSVAITRTFEILKSGTQVLGDATPSAMLAPTPTATLAGEPIPETGSSFPLVVMLILGIGLVSSGLMLTYARRYS